MTNELKLKCPECGGKGKRYEGSRELREFFDNCPTCAGAGALTLGQAVVWLGEKMVYCSCSYDFHGKKFANNDCPKCKGTGEVLRFPTLSKVCPHCGNANWVGHCPYSQGQCACGGLECVFCKGTGSVLADVHLEDLQAVLAKAGLFHKASVLASDYAGQIIPDEHSVEEVSHAILAAWAAAAVKAVLEKA